MTSRTGAYYHRYLDRLLEFLVPAGKRIYRSVDGSLPDPNEPYDYIVLADVLGQVGDVEQLLKQVRELITKPHGRVVITQYSQLWEPILRAASALRLRRSVSEQNWLSPADLENFLTLAGWEPVVRGRKILLPINIPVLTPLVNRFFANLPLINRLCLVHYVVARPTPPPQTTGASVSIIVPARNEAGTIRRIIDELPAVGTFTEIIFIEGNSTDTTRSVIEREVAAYRGPKRLSWAVQSGKGKGDAVRKGFAMATGDILMIYDADMTVPPEEVQKFYDALVSGRAEFANGSRLVYPMESQSMRTLNYIANKFFGIAFSWLLGRPMKDTLCGTKVLWRTDYEDIARGRAFFGDFDPFGDFDLLFGAAKLNRAIVDIPVHYRDRVYGETNISRFRHGWLLLQMVIFAARKMKFI